MIAERKDFTPRGYGKLITGHILDVPRNAIWAGMGLGKTVSTLNAIDLECLAGDDHPTLVCAPLRVAQSTWPDEARKWKHLRHVEVAPIVGSVKERLQALRHDVAIHSINYENLPWLIEHLGERWPYRRVVLDESTKVKSLRLSYRTSTTGKEFLAGQGGKRAAALGRIAHTKVKQLIELTGTCAPNGLQDLWGQVWYIDAGKRLGRTFTSFKERWFCKSFDGYNVEPNECAQDQIQNALSDVCLSIDAKDWFDLAEPIVNNIYIDLPPSVRKQYREMERKMFTEIEGQGVEAVNAAARTSKCLQIASGSVWVDREGGDWRQLHEAKLNALDDIYEEAAGMPLLIRYHWIPSRDAILHAFPKLRVLDKNPQTLRDWNAGKIPGLIAHAQSCGHGLNMQDGGNIIVNYDQWWDLEHAMQILERIGPVRQMQSGYDRPVFIHNLIGRDTLDEDVLERLVSKRSVQNILLQAMKRKGYQVPAIVDYL